MDVADLDVLLVQRSDVSFCPPTQNQANILLRSGLRVGLLDSGRHGERLEGLDEGVIRYSMLSPVEYMTNIGFALLFKKVLFDSRASVCIAYDPPAISLLGSLSFSGKKIFHFHEFPADPWELDRRLMGKIVTRVAIAKSKKADLIVFADSHRASAFYLKYELPSIPMVVRNCVPKVINLPKGSMSEMLSSRQFDSEQVVLFQGAVSDNYFARNIIESMRFWPDHAGIVFLGPISDSINVELTNKAESVGVRDRLLILGQLPYRDLFSYTVDADVLLTLAKPVTFNYMHNAGASNKRYEAMACGVPQITNVGPGMRELIEDNGIGICVNAANPEILGREVYNLLMDNARRKEMSRAARQLHLDRFNYEKEFLPVLNIIRNWIAEQ